MSAGVGIWKETLARAAHLRVRKQEFHSANAITPGNAPLALLVQQLFFSAVPRNRVLLVAAGPETNVSAICEQAGGQLSELSGKSVAAFVHAASVETSTRKPPHSIDPEGFWLTSGVQLTNRLWKFPSSMLASVPGANGRGLLSWKNLPFDYVLCASVVSDSLTPLLCGICDGTVLVITANQTRRESALRAKEILQQCHATLLGTVLHGRKFPIPESIYRRL